MANYDNIFGTPEEKTTPTATRNQMSPDERAAMKRQERSDAYALADKTAKEIVSDPQNFRDYLDVQSRFDRYSATNTLLIYAHNINATQLRDRKSWKDAGITVNKGEKGIPILEPGESYERDDSSIGTYYNVKWVYDISQTDAVPTAEPMVNRDERQMLKALIAKRSVPIELEDNVPHGAIYDHSKGRILVQKGMEGPDIFRSVSFALAHAELAQNDPSYTPNKAGFKAYCISYMLCQKYGVDTSGYDFRQIPSELRNADSKTLRAELTGIRNTMNSISSRIAKNLDQTKKDSKAQER